VRKGPANYTGNAGIRFPVSVCWQAKFAGEKALTSDMIRVRNEILYSFYLYSIKFFLGRGGIFFPRLFQQVEYGDV